MKYFIIWVEGFGPKRGEKIQSIKRGEKHTYTTLMGRALRVSADDKEFVKSLLVLRGINNPTFIPTSYVPKWTLFNKEAYKAGVEQGSDPGISDHLWSEYNKSKRRDAEPQILMSPDCFGHTWQLKAFGRIFFLGQDQKVLDRLLCTDGRTLARELNVAHPIDMRSRRIRIKIAKHIINHVGLTRSSARGLESWGLAVN